MRSRSPTTFEAVSAAEARAAELFYRDLIGATGRRRRVRAPRSSVGFGLAPDGAWPSADEQSSGGAEVRVEAATGLGSQRTTAPIATTSPHRQLNAVLDKELILFTQARAFVEWLDTKLFTDIGAALGDAALRQKLDVSSDRALAGRLRPFSVAERTITRKVNGRDVTTVEDFPKKSAQLFPTIAATRSWMAAPANAAQLRPLLVLLDDYGVILGRPPRTPTNATRITASITRVEARLVRERFDEAATKVETMARKFKRDIALEMVRRNVVETSPIDPAWAGGSSTKLAARTFATPVVELLTRLRARNDAWNATTYRPHFWNEFSIDVWLKLARREDGFWLRDPTRKFFDDLAAACAMTSGVGIFAWKALYNDDDMIAYVDGRYGSGRVLEAPGHGPGGKMHVHLDVRPLGVPLDAKTDFTIQNGRVVPR